MTVETRDGEEPSFTNPDVGFKIVTAENNKPTGEIVCDECGASAYGLPNIEHETGCPQAGVR